MTGRPFAALTGHGAAIAETERETTKVEVILSLQKKNLSIEPKQHQISRKPFYNGLRLVSYGTRMMGVLDRIKIGMIR